MWAFTEHEIEQFLVTPKRGRKAVITINDRSFLVVWTQPGLVVLEGSRRNPQPPLFPAFKDLDEFLPDADGPEKRPDIVAILRSARQQGAGIEPPVPLVEADSSSETPGSCAVNAAPVTAPVTAAMPTRRPSRVAEIFVFELKNRAAAEKDIAQLRRYLNLVRFSLDYNVGNIKHKLHARGAYRVRGILLATSIPKDLWLAASSPYDTPDPEIELVAFWLDPDPDKKRIRTIHFADRTAMFRKQFELCGRQYRKHHRSRRNSRLEEIPVATPATPQPQAAAISENVEEEPPPPEQQTKTAGHGLFPP